jgi:hypothetical protein
MRFLCNSKTANNSGVYQRSISEDNSEKQRGLPLLSVLASKPGLRGDAVRDERSISYRCFDLGAWGEQYDAIMAILRLLLW